FWFANNYTLRGTHSPNFIETGTSNSGILEGFSIDDWAESRTSSNVNWMLQCGVSYRCSNLTVNDWYSFVHSSADPHAGIVALQLARLDHTTAFNDDGACVSWSTGIQWLHPYCGNSAISTLTYTKGDSGGLGSNPDFGGVMYESGYLDECYGTTST